MLGTIVVAVILHLVGDYVLQRFARKALPQKRTSCVGMVIHATYADSVCFAWLGWALWGNIYGITICGAVGVASHYIIDTLLPHKKTLALSIIDQILHALVATVLIAATIISRAR